ncbi:MAG TPA: Hpt domain-containing protein [Aromatoleum sp.]|uniref:Hpt domain-containing protein n=1 Tax=Aromatoleum sp. TaxID=2307007 RepID=UPI002B4A28CC|nr:Hpt domain-containing protein [Aromatoleum sp.]HJV27489.1 Hpt domain-containing protein [Aromatoleum sp.]
MADDPLAAKIAVLQRAFVAQLPERIRALDEALAKLGQDEETVKAVHVIVHSLAGAGATFGCPEVSAAAREMEQAMFPGGLGHSKFDPAVHARLPVLMAALKAAAQRAVAENPESGQP